MKILRNISSLLLACYLLSILISCRNEDDSKIIKFSDLYSPKSKINFSINSGIYKNNKLSILISDSNATKIVLIENKDSLIFSGNSFNYELISRKPSISFIPTASKNYDT